MNFSTDLGFFQQVFIAGTSRALLKNTVLSVQGDVVYAQQNQKLYI